MTRGRVWFGVASLIAVAILVALALWRVRTSDDPRSPTITEAPSTEQARGAAAGGPVEGVVLDPILEDSDAPATATEEAMAALARHTRQSWARCPLPDTVRPGAHSDEPRVEEVDSGALYMLLDADAAEEEQLWISAPPTRPEPPSKPAPEALADLDARRDAGDLTEAEHRDQTTELYDAAFTAASEWRSEGFLPMAIAAVGTFAPGQQIDCSVHDEQVEVTVVARYPDGRPADRALASANWGGGTFETNADGEANVVVWKGLDVMVSAREWSSDPSEFPEPARGDADVRAPMGGERVPITLDLQGTAYRTLTDDEVAAMHEAEAEQGLDLSDALEAALAEPGISARAREKLVAWSKRLQQEADDKLDLADEIAADTDGDPLSRRP